MRDITDVINQIKAVMPAKSVWQNDLDKLLVSVKYTPPEGAGHRWQELGDIVNGSLVDAPWKQQMVDILTNAPTTEATTEEI